MINVGIIGAGRIGKLHVANLMSRVSNAQVVAVTDVVPAVSCGVSHVIHRDKSVL